MERLGSQAPGRTAVCQHCRCSQQTVFQPRRSARRHVLTVRAASISSNDFRPGVTIEMDGAPWRVQEFLHVKPGKGAAFVRSKLKNYLTGNTVEKTFRAGEAVESALVERSPTQFTYADGDDYVFMNMETYEETRLRKDDSWARYMVEGMDVSLLTWNGKVISVDPPPVVELEVVRSDPGAKGNTASGGGSKPATLSSGAEIMVPLFINEGSKVKVDTRTNTYAGRGST